MGIQKKNPNQNTSCIILYYLVTVSVRNDTTLRSVWNAWAVLSWQNNFIL